MGKIDNTTYFRLNQGTTPWRYVCNAAALFFSEERRGISNNAVVTNLCNFSKTIIT